MLLNHSSIENEIIRLSWYQGLYKAAIVISFDVESAAVSENTPKRLLIQKINKHLNKFRTRPKSLGIGYNNRASMLLIKNKFKEYNIHGTWFVTGHCLLKGNQDRNAYRINQKAAFTPLDDLWRLNRNTFFDEPYSDYKKRPDYYYGDLIEWFNSEGEDIQSHSFSHPYFSLETVENLKTDLEDWQNCAFANKLNLSKVFAFPYFSDCHYYYPDLNLKMPIRNRIENTDPELERVDDERLNILKSNNFELLARCRSKFPQEPGSGFIPYDQDSGFFYIPFKTLFMSDYDHDSYRTSIQEIIDNENLVDFWCHPHNIRKDNLVNFENFLHLVHEYRQNGDLLITTMNDAWEHFSQVKQVVLDITETENEGYLITLTNKGQKKINKLGFVQKQPNFSMKSHPEVLTDPRNNNRFVIREIGPGAVLNLEFIKN